MLRSQLLILVAAFLLTPLSARAQWALNGKAISTVANSENFITPIPDGAGGAFIVWEDNRFGVSTTNIYVQRIDASGVPQWANGIPVCTASNIQRSPVIIADGFGGVIVAWDDDRVAAANRDIYAQRVNGSGVVQWTANGVAVSTAANHQQYPRIASDGTGGAIVSWNDDRAAVNSYHVYAQRVNASGTPQWTANGIAIYTASTGFEHPMISDGAGGAIISYTAGSSLNAQRLNASGALQWGASGVTLCAAAAVPTLAGVVSDGAAGAIVAWSDNRSGAQDVYARRVTSAGVPQWTANGVPLCTVAGDQWASGIVANGAGGAIIAWEDRRNGAAGTRNDIYAQQVTSSGAAQWTAEGLGVCTASLDQYLPQMVSDGADGAILTWTDGRSPVSDIYAQRVNNAGAPLWTVNGVPVCVAGDPFSPAMVSNGVGGAIIAWRDTRNAGTAIDAYAQRIEARYGNWGRPDGWITSVNDVPGDQGGHVMTRWDASDRDVFPAQEISHYTLWRELGAAAASAVAASMADAFVDPSGVGPDFAGKAYRTSTGAVGSTTWEFIATIPIRYATEYGFNTTTLGDSVASNSADGTYQVLSHTTNAFVYYEGNLFTGHSVDNLSPPAPLSLTAQRSGANVNLHWHRVHVSDIRDYSVYRKTSAGVTPVPLNFLADSYDTVLVDTGAPASALYYVVTASDVHDNQSLVSNEASVSPVTGVGDLPPITALTVLQNHPNPFTGLTQFEVGLPAASTVSLEVYDVAGRRVRSESLPRQAAGWQRLSFDGRDNAGRALASGVYFCRLTAGGATVTRKIVIAR